MKMANGGFNPAVNVQFATDTESRVITGVEVSAEGNDHHLAEPMRRQVEQRTGRTVHEHLMDGGYLVLEEIQTAADQGVTVYVPPKPPRDPRRAGEEFTPKAAESRALGDWRQRMGSEDGREIYKGACGDERDGERRPAPAPRHGSDAGARAEEGQVRGAVARDGVQHPALRRGVDRLTREDRRHRTNGTGRGPSNQEPAADRTTCRHPVDRDRSRRPMRKKSRVAQR
jgi:hypothetical protein